MTTIDVRSLGRERLNKIRAIGWLVGNVEAAERVARLQETSPIPRGQLAGLLRKFVAMFDRERAWHELDQGDEIRTRTLAVADALDEQAKRAAMP